MTSIGSIVLVCHYFPPQDNVGVRRVLFWANYFVRLGLRVVVVTTKKNASSKMYLELDSRVDVIEVSILGGARHVPKTYQNAKSDRLEKAARFSGVSKKVFQISRSFKQRFINNTFGQLLDPRIIQVVGFIFYIRCTKLKKVSSVLPQGGVVLSTAPPWPMHLAGACLAHFLHAKFVVDYRDPFSNHHMFSSRFRFIEEWLDSRICRNAEMVFSVSPSWVKYYTKYNSNTKLIRNGYDEAMIRLSNGSHFDIKKSSRIELNYFGSVEHESRFPHSIFKFLESCNLDIRLNFYGVCPLVENYLESKPMLSKIVFVHGKLDYKAAIEKMTSSEINFVCEMVVGENPSTLGLIPTKIYEYIACRRPIIALVNPRSDMVKILRKSGLLINSSLCVEQLENELVAFRGSGDELAINIDYIKSLSRQNSANEALEYMTAIL